MVVMVDVEYLAAVESVEYLLACLHALLVCVVALVVLFQVDAKIRRVLTVAIATTRTTVKSMLPHLLALIL